MKWLVSILLFFITACCFGQPDRINYSRIDWKVQSIEPASSPAILAKNITASYSTDHEKVRAIFSWIAGNISYRVKNSYNYRRKNYVETGPVIPDTGVLKSANEAVAETVLANRSAICDGYSRLFKTLCDYAGIESAIVTGYARSNIGRTELKFRSNHNWNAVYIDSAWYLLDVTWASGSVSYYGDAFIQHFDDYYFFTSPELFIRDHWPDDMRWALLPNPPALREFDRMPFRQRSFIKYNITSYLPQTGVIEAAVGDTVLLELQTADFLKDKAVAPDTIYMDSTQLYRSSNLTYLQPEWSGNKARYRYIVESADIEWLHLLYNKDVVLRYKIKIRKNKSRADFAFNR